MVGASRRARPRGAPAAPTPRRGGSRRWHSRCGGSSHRGGSRRRPPRHGRRRRRGSHRRSRRRGAEMVRLPFRRDDARGDDRAADRRERRPAAEPETRRRCSDEAEAQVRVIGRGRPLGAFGPGRGAKARKAASMPSSGAPWRRAKARANRAASPAFSRTRAATEATRRSSHASGAAAGAARGASGRVSIGGGVTTARGARLVAIGRLRHARCSHRTDTRAHRRGGVCSA